MTTPNTVDFIAEDIAGLSERSGTVVVFLGADGTLSAPAAALDAAMGGALSRATGADDFKAKPGKIVTFGYPGALAADRVLLAAVGDAPDRADVRKCGGAIATALGKGAITVAGGRRSSRRP